MIEAKMVAPRKELIEYATHVEGMIDKSITGLMRKDSPTLTEVIEKDEPKANESEIAIEELCTTMIAPTYFNTSRCRQPFIYFRLCQQVPQ